MSRHENSEITGKKIKKYRELRGMTKKELGIRCGFPENAAGVRIRQYEDNIRNPMFDIRKKIARALDIDTSALMNEDMSSEENIIHVLFDLESNSIIEPRKLQGKYCLELINPPPDTEAVNRYIKLSLFMKDWLEAKDAFKISENDPPDLIMEKNHGYQLWKASYVKDHINDSRDLNNLLQKKESLERELELTNQLLLRYEETDKSI